MKKTICLFLLVLMSVFTLSACDFINNIQGKVDFEVQGINGHTDALIDGETRTISFSVSSGIDEFNLSDIIIPSNASAKAYLGENELGDCLVLEDGENTYRIVFSVNSSALSNAIDNLNINALNNSTTYE